MGLGSFINRASSIPVIKGAEAIRLRELANFRMIGLSNPLDGRSLHAVNNHFSPKKFTLSSNQANTYVAASTLLHSLDGWQYLSHSIDSLIKGDRGIAVHLAYYAELRATMSFLASEGIGVFSSKHFALTKTNEIIKNPKVKKRVIRGGAASTSNVNTGTHQFVWDVVEQWTNSAVKPSLSILKIFSVSGKSFDQWIEAFHPQARSYMSAPIIQNWLRDWNFDVKLLRGDRELRNEVSYRPQRMKNLRPNDLDEVIDKLSSFWKAITPNSPDRFDLLDKFLLRKLLRQLYVNLRSSIGSSIDFRTQIDEAFIKLRLTPAPSLIKFLNSDAPFGEDHILFSEAARAESNNPLAVIARSMLMLRIATGSTSQIFKSAGCTKTHLNFLWENLGVDNGFWIPGDLPSNFDRLWTDIENEISELTEWYVDNRPGISLSSISMALPAHLYLYKQFNRAALWGLAL